MLNFSQRDRIWFNRIAEIKFERKFNILRFRLNFHTAGAESCAYHVAWLLSRYVLLEGGKIRVFPEFMQKKNKKINNFQKKIFFSKNFQKFYF